MLVEPNIRYIERVEGSAHFLSSPKRVLNDVLDSFYRQFHDNDEKAIGAIANYLRGYAIAEPISTAIRFVNWRKTITAQEFMKINVDTYVDNCPKHITKMLNEQSEWIINNTTYYPFTGIRKSVPSYPYKYHNL